MILGKLAQEPVAGLGGRGAMKIKLRRQGEHLLLLHEAGQDLFQPGVESLGAAGQVGLGDGDRRGRADGVFHESGVVADRRGLHGQVFGDAGPIAFEPPLDGLDDRAAADGADRAKNCGG